MARTLRLVVAATIAGRGGSQEVWNDVDGWADFEKQVAELEEAMHVTEPAVDQGPMHYVRLEMYAPASSSPPRWLEAEFGNENMYDAPGLLKYLMTELLPERGKDPRRKMRPGGVDNIIRYHLRVFNPPGAELPTYPGEFGPYASFLGGAAAADANLSRFASTGAEVGVEAFRTQGELPNGGTIPADPRFAFNGTYYRFSLSGPCPNLKDAYKGQHDAYNESCVRYQHGPRIGSFVEGTLCNIPGHLFRPARSREMPTGAPGCSVVVEHTDRIMLDELAGIYDQDCGSRPCRDWLDFRVNCTDESLKFEHEGRKYCREFDFAEGCSDSCLASTCRGQRDLGLENWQGRCDATKNVQRTLAIRRLLDDYARPESVSDLHYANNPPCSRHPYCSSPIPDQGSAYCHRDSSGVCDLCYIPGTSKAPSSRSPGLHRCRLDLFIGSVPQYKSQRPVCASSCDSTNECSDATDEDLCCLYIGACTRDWQVGEWSVCSANCGPGSQTRLVSCPFQALFGPCSDATMPLLIQECQERECPE